MTDPLLAKYGTGRQGHSHFAPSSAAGWLTCAGYILANATASDTAGEDAAYGTVAHMLAQDWQEHKAEPTHRVGLTVKSGKFRIQIDADMIGFVKQYIEWCDELPGEHYYEQRVDLSHLTPIPNQGGTADHFALHGRTLTVTDLKMGMGVFVPVENNPQALLYALGAFNEWDWAYRFETITIRICQPRLNYFGVWTVDRAALLAFESHVKIRARAAWVENAPRTPSEKACRFCSAKVHCPAVSAHLEAIVDDSFDIEDEASYTADEMIAHSNDITSVSFGAAPIALSTAFLAYRLRYRKLYEGWFNAIYDELLGRAERGDAVPGWKLLDGKRFTHWTDPDAGVARLVDEGLTDDELYTTKVISVAQARKALRSRKLSPAAVEDVLEGLIAVKPGRRSLGRDDDPRADQQDTIDDMLEGGEETD